jgi:PhnB protein
VKQFYPHLTFQGHCEEAFKFYAKCLGGEITLMMTYGESPMEGYPPDWGGKILHATFALGHHMFSGSDAPDENYQKPQGFAMQLNLSDAAEADRIFSSLAENGSVHMPIQQTFWALRYGDLVDRFGTPWMINCEKTAEEVG